jgi:hypothetical protein
MRAMLVVVLLELDELPLEISHRGSISDPDRRSTPAVRARHP